jgi:hypothetical protein
VIAELPREDDVAARRPGVLPREPAQLHGHGGALGPAAREVHARQSVTGELRQTGGEPDRRLVRELPERGVELELVQLLGGRARQLGPSVPDRALPQPARAVDVLVAVAVPQERALPAHEHGRRLGPSDHLVRMDDVGTVEPVQLGRGRDGVPAPLLRELAHQDR